MERRIKRGWMKLKVASITQETPDTVTLHMTDADEGSRQFDYQAGQYLTFRFDDISEKPVVRSYTMSSSPTHDKDHIDVTVKEVADPFISKHLCRDIQVGDILKARGPIGRFGYDPAQDHAHVIMVAGGSGVTPFLSLMREYSAKLGQENAPTHMTLLTSFRTREDIICQKHLEALAKIPGMRVVITLSREDASSEGFHHGRIDQKLIASLCNEHLHNATFMTCGPEAIMDTTVRYLETAQVDPKHIKTESFH